MDSLMNIKNKNKKNEINNQKRIVHLLGSTTPQKTYNNSSETFCKKLGKFNSCLKIKNKNSYLKLPFYITNMKNDYNYDLIMIEKPDDNSKKFSNRLERIENSIYQFFKTKKKNNKIPLLKYKLNFINKINLAESNAYSKDNKNKKINTFLTKTDNKNKFLKKKEGSENKNSKEIYNTIFYNSINSNDDYCSIKDKYNSSIKNKRYHTISNNNIKDLKIKGIKIKFSHDLIKKIK
jgi:hypothetical protein